MRNRQTHFLHTLATVADLRSFTRTGEVLGRTQPAISLQVKRLEDTVGPSLFERDSTRFRLTPAGELLAIYARQILSASTVSSRPASGMTIMWFFAWTRLVAKIARCLP